jgi:hypothetical protein
VPLSDLAKHFAKCSLHTKRRMNLSLGSLRQPPCWRDDDYSTHGL